MSVPSVPVEENNQFELWTPNKQSLREKTAQMPEISKASSVVITLQDLREYLDEHSEKCRGCGKPLVVHEYGGVFYLHCTTCGQSSPNWERITKRKRNRRRSRS